MVIIFGVRTTDGNYGPFEFYEDAYEFAEQHGDPAPVIVTFTDDWSSAIDGLAIPEFLQRTKPRS